MLTVLHRRHLKTPFALTPLWAPINSGSSLCEGACKRKGEQTSCQPGVVRCQRLGTTSGSDDPSSSGGRYSSKLKKASELNSRFNLWRALCLCSSPGTKDMCVALSGTSARHHAAKYPKGAPEPWRLLALYVRVLTQAACLLQTQNMLARLWFSLILPTICPASLRTASSS